MKLSEQASTGIDLSRCAKQARASSAIEGHEVSDAQALQALEEAKRMTESGEAATMLAELNARFSPASSRKEDLKKAQ